MNYKSIKLLILTLVIALATFTSCKDDAIIDTPNDTEESVAAKASMIALRSHFNNDRTLRTGNNPVGNIIFDFCFEFVYPVTLTYNNDTNVTVQDFDGLMDVLIGMTDALYIDGIVFPFNVETFTNGAIEVVTISTEAEFMTLIDGCGIDDDGNEDDCVCTADYAPVCVEMQDPNGDTFAMEFPNFCYAECEGFTQNDVVDCDDSNPANNDNFFGACFDFVYPISVTDYDGTVITINNDQELADAMFTIFVFEFVYPFSVITENQETLAINNMEEFVELIDQCEGADCDSNCPQNVDPVCVETPIGEIVSFNNYCLAACAGFTQQDLVDCNPSSDCIISDLTVTNIACVSDTQYEASLNFYVADTDETQFLLYTDGVAEYYDIADLPLTLILNDNGSDYAELQVQFANCEEFVGWDVPDCNTSTDCEISSIVVYNLTCISEEVYTMVLDFNYQNAPNTTFDLTINSQTTTVDLSQLPLTIDYLVADAAYLEVSLGGNCMSAVDWTAPDCATQACWEFVYPLELSTPIGNVTVNTRAEFDAQFDANSYMLIYPFDVIIDGVTRTIESPNSFYEIGEYDTMCD